MIIAFDINHENESFIKENQIDKSNGDDNENGNDKSFSKHFSNSSTNLLSVMDDYDLERIKVIGSIIAPFNQQGVAINIGQIIEEYEWDKPLEDLYEEIIDELSLSDKEEENLNFHDHDFANKFYQIITIQENSLEENNFPYSSHFWYNLLRLLFKWIIYMRQSVDEREFKRILENTRSFMSMISDNIGLDFPLDLNPRSIEGVSCNELKIHIFQSLVSCEIIDNPLNFSIFNSILHEAYGSGEQIERGRINFSCDELKNKYFNGNFDSNVLLKLAIIFHDPLGMIRRECFSKESPLILDSRLDHSAIGAIMKNPRLRGYENLEISIFEFVNSFILRSFLKNNQRFLVCNSVQLLALLTRLDDSGLLTRTILERIIEFKFVDGKDICKWDQRKFDRILNASIRKGNVSDYDKKNERLDLLKLFRLIKESIYEETNS